MKTKKSINLFPIPKNCPNCKASFTCSSEQGNACWCFSLPALLPIDETSTCLCKACLLEKLLPKVQEIVLAIKEGHRQNNVKDLYLHPSNELIEGLDYYLEGGLWVFTEWFYLKRGYCCGNACRHCPYNHENVPRD